MKLSSRGAIAPFQVMDILREANARAAAGAQILHLEAGEPGGAVAEPVRRAAERALASGRVGYTEPLGLPALRSRIASFYGERYGLDVPASRIVVTSGASAGFILAFLALFEAGGRVALAEPGYPAYRNILSALGLEPVALPGTSATRYQPTPAMLRGAGALDGLILQSPANPTGTMLAPGELRALVDEALAARLWLVSDEIYHGITYDAPAETALRFTDEAIIVNSFSKYFCMTGWRIGWLVLPERVIRPVELLAQSLFISPNALSQYAALGAFEALDEFDRRVVGYRRNRDLLAEALKDAGADIIVADGAFYLYADIRMFTNDAEAFCARMLAETGVAATPGTDFDPVGGRTAIRFSFAGTHADIEAAAARLRPWLKRCGERGV